MDKQAFMDELMPIPETGCLLWPRFWWKTKYGCAYVPGIKSPRAHIIAWEIANGPRPEGKFEVCHKCDTPPCCNPEHLFLGTRKENANDAVRKGRHTYGEKSHFAKLSEETVLEILRLWPSIQNTCEMGRMFSIHRSQIDHIVKRKAWKHLHVGVKP